MDANVSIALFTKIKNVYESPGSNKFISFPFFSFNVAPENFDIFLPENINLNDSGVAVKKVIDNQREFFKVFDDLIECQDKFKPIGNLSSVYLDVISNANFVDVTENKNVLKEINKLTKKLMNKSGVLTKKYNTYLEYQRLYYEAQNNFRNDSTNQDLIDNLDKANINWIVKGYKNFIEDITSQLLALNNAIGTNLYQSEIIKMFQKNSYPIMENSIAMPDYLTTYYSPKNILSPEIKWQTINLFSENEITDLYEKAPEGIKNLIGTITSSNTIISLSIDVAYVDIVRDWFDSKLFEKKTWSFSDKTKKISDGNKGYIKAILLAKNLKISYKTNNNPQVVVASNLILKDFMKFNKLSVVSKLKDVNILNPVLVKETVTQPVNNFTVASPVATTNPSVLKTNANLKFSRSSFILSKPILIQNQPVPTSSTSTESASTSIPPKTEENTNQNIDIIALVCEKIPSCP